MANIIDNNKDIETAMFAGCKYGFNCLGIWNKDKNLSFLLLADLHGDDKCLQSAIEYSNYYDCFDATINLGDIQPSNFSENDGKWFNDSVKKANKPFYSIIGNHDIGNGTDGKTCATKEQFFDKFFKPNLDIMNMPKLDKTYYFVNFDKYKVSVIFLDIHDGDESKDENGDFKIHRIRAGLSEEQMSWFLNTLKNIPNDYQLLIVTHTVSEPIYEVENAFTEFGMNEPCGDILYYNQYISDIVDAWKNAKKFEASFAPCLECPSQPSYSVSVDFSNRKKGVFIGYLTGHWHMDIIGKVMRHPDQNFYTFGSACCDNWQNHKFDLPRVKGTKSEDCLTAFSIDTKNRCVNLVRIGSNITFKMTERKMTSIKY